MGREKRGECAINSGLWGCRNLRIFTLKIRNGGQTRGNDAHVAALLPTIALLSGCNYGVMTV